MRQFILEWIWCDILSVDLIEVWASRVSARTGFDLDMIAIITRVAVRTACCIYRVYNLIRLEHVCDTRGMFRSNLQHDDI